MLYANGDNAGKQNGKGERQRACGDETTKSGDMFLRVGQTRGGITESERELGGGRNLWGWLVSILPLHSKEKAENCVKYDRSRRSRAQPMNEAYMWMRMRFHAEGEASRTLLVLNFFY